jgi:hypothetical protein
VRIVEIVNRKPCCGEIRVGKWGLLPGEDTDIEISLSVREEFGDLIHEAVVMTQPPTENLLVLRTIARVYPQVRIEETTHANGTVILRETKPTLAEFRVVAHGSLSQRPVDLDRCELVSTTQAGWLGPKAGLDSEDGIRSETRRFFALLDTQGATGMRSATFHLRDCQALVLEHTVNWEVVAPIAAAPKMIVISGSGREFRVQLRSHDGAVFRVLSVSSDTARIHGRVVGASSAPMQVVVLQVRPGEQSERSRGRLSVMTDHPSQREVEIPIVVVE